MRAYGTKICVDWDHDCVANDDMTPTDWNNHSENTRTRMPIRKAKVHGHGPGESSSHEHMRGGSPQDHNHHGRRLKFWETEEENTLLEGSGNLSEEEYEIWWSSGKEFMFERLARRQRMKSFC